MPSISRPEDHRPPMGPLPSPSRPTPPSWPHLEMGAETTESGPRLQFGFIDSDTKLWSNVCSENDTDLLSASESIGRGWAEIRNCTNIQTLSWATLGSYKHCSDHSSAWKGLPLSSQHRHQPSQHVCNESNGSVFWVWRQLGRVHIFESQTLWPSAIQLAFPQQSGNGEPRRFPAKRNM